MKGTEKQIAWAKELMKKMNKEFSIVLGMVPENQKAIFSDLFEKINAIMNDSYAGDIIYHLKDNKKVVSIITNHYTLQLKLMPMQWQ
nr:MAG TPA: hypothetical protein [Caudoviricetes sp.]